MANISAKIPEMKALQTDLMTKSGVIEEKTEAIKAKLTAIVATFDTTATQALIEKYTSNIDPIMKKMSETVKNGMTSLNTIIGEYEAAEEANINKLSASADNFTQPNYQA